MTTATKTQIAYSQRGLELVKAWGGSLDGSRPPDDCTAKHQARVRCGTCGNTPPTPNILDASPLHADVLRELRWAFWYGGNTFTAAPNLIDVAAEKAVRPSPDHIAAERLLAEKQAAFETVLQALAVATAEHDKATRDRTTFVRDGMLFTSGGRAVARLEREVDEARRALEDAEHDLRRARSEVGEHEEFLDNQRLVWREKHRAEFA